MYPHELIKRHDEVVGFVLDSNLVVVRDLVKNLVDNVRKHEVIRCHRWIESKWYFQVEDSLLRQTTKNSDDGIIACFRIAFTADIKADKMVWNYQGGNNCLRDRHWKRMFTCLYPQQAADNDKRQWRKERRPEHRHMHLYSLTPTGTTLFRTGNQPLEAK